MYKCNVRRGGICPPIIEPRQFDRSIVSTYAVNDAGFLRSDFAQLNERADSLSLARILSQMEEMSTDDSNKGKTIEEMFDTLKPRSLQTPCELDRFEQYCIDRSIDFYKKIKESEVAKLSTGSSEPPISQSSGAQSVSE